LSDGWCYRYCYTVYLSRMLSELGRPIACSMLTLRLQFRDLISLVNGQGQINHHQLRKVRQTTSLPNQHDNEMDAFARILLAKLSFPHRCILPSVHLSWCEVEVPISTFFTFCSPARDLSIRSTSKPRTAPSAKHFSRNLQRRRSPLQGWRGRATRIQAKIKSRKVPFLRPLFRQ
jgi:hypothetical protein